MLKHFGRRRSLRFEVIRALVSSNSHTALKSPHEHATIFLGDATENLERLLLAAALCASSEDVEAIQSILHALQKGE